MVVPEPEEPTAVQWLLDILVEIDAEARKDPQRGAECLPRYWQEKKDGIRVAMIVLDVMEDRDLNNITQLQRTSRNSRYTPGEKMRYLIMNDPVPAFMFLSAIFLRLAAGYYDQRYMAQDLYNSFIPTFLSLVSWLLLLWGWLWWIFV